MATEPGELSPPERAIRDHLAAGEIDAAAALTLRTYGAELLGFLHAVCGRPQDAEDAWSLLSTAVWTSLPSFAGRSSLRTWLYVLARRSVTRATRGQRRDQLPLSQASAIDRLAAEVRATSFPHLAPVRDRFAQLRAQLDPDDQVLLVLRVDRELAWRDIAEVVAEDDADADLDKVAAALRKRFERAKVRIRELALEAGLVPRG